MVLLTCNYCKKDIPENEEEICQNCREVIHKNCSAACTGCGDVFCLNCLTEKGFKILCIQCEMLENEDEVLGD